MDFEELRKLVSTLREYVTDEKALEIIKELEEELDYLWNAYEEETWGESL